MIFDTISNLKHYAIIGSQFHSITDMLKGADKMEYSKMIDINDGLRVIKLNKFSDGLNFEFHKKYIDVHITIDGIDEILLGDTNEAKLIDEFDTKSDYQLVSTATVLSIKNIPGFFTALMPGELHRNIFLQENTNKLVFKITYYGQS